MHFLGGRGLFILVKNERGGMSDKNPLRLKWLKLETTHTILLLSRVTSNYI